MGALRRVRTFALAAVAAIAIAACGPGPAGEAAAGSGHIVYLSFADGTEGIAKGADDDATRNVSRICATERFARWEGAEGCGDRETCRDVIRERVAEYFRAYDVRFTTVRPPPSTAYAMIVIAPPNEDCTFGRRGVAFADCGDANPSSVGFVFDCESDPGECAVLVAHETAHTFGLVHAIDDGDVMTSAPEDPELRFKETAAEVAENECGVTTQSSHDVLLLRLGPAAR